MIKLEEMSFSFIVTHGQEFTLTAEGQREGILKDSGGDAWEVLVNSIGGDMSKAEGILLPLGTDGKHLTGVVELEISD